MENIQSPSYLEPHKDIAGYKIEHVLRGLATDPNFTTDGRLMAKKVLTEGDTSALWPLHDEIMDTNHPAGKLGYKLLNAASKIHLDRAIGHAVDALRGNASIGSDMHHIALGQLRQAILNDVGTNPKASEAVELLWKQGHTPSDMLESLQRHTQRSGRNIRLRLGQTTPEKESVIAHNPKGNDPELYTVGQKATKYGRFRPNNEFNRSVSDAGQQSLAGRYVDAITAHHSKGLYAPETSADWLDRMKAQFPKAHTGDTYHHYAHQLAAVAAGKQPSASVDRAFLELHPVGQEFARRFDNAGVDMDAWVKGGQEQITVGSPTDKKDSGKVGGKGLSFVKSNLPALSLMGTAEKYSAKRTPVHPLVKGTRLAIALKVMTKGKNPLLKTLASNVLRSGDTNSLLVMADALDKENGGEYADHPLAGAYDWRGAARRLHLDAAVHPVLDAQAVADYPDDIDMQNTHREFSVSHIADRFDRWADLKGSVEYPTELSSVENAAVQVLPDHTLDELKASVRRFAIKAMDSHRRNRFAGRTTETDLYNKLHKTDVNKVQKAAISPEPTPVDNNPIGSGKTIENAEGLSASRFRNSLSDVPEKYQASPALSEFIQAVRNVRSSNQQVRRDIAKAQYKKLKLDLKSLMDAISDGPTTASANTAHYVEHEGDYDKVRAGAALYGLQTDSPSLMLFHMDDEGPDSLVKINVTGSAERLRRKLDNAGLVNRTLIPNENGWSCLLVDKGGDSLPVIRKFAQSEGVPIEHSRGHSEVLGGGDEAEGDKGSRKSYRSVISKWEKGQQQPVQYAVDKPYAYVIPTVEQLAKDEKADHKAIGRIMEQVTDPATQTALGSAHHNTQQQPDADGELRRLGTVAWLVESWKWAKSKGHQQAADTVADVIKAFGGIPSPPEGALVKFDGRQHLSDKPVFTGDNVVVKRIGFAYKVKGSAVPEVVLKADTEPVTVPKQPIRNVPAYKPPVDDGGIPDLTLLD